MTTKATSSLAAVEVPSSEVLELGSIATTRPEPPAPERPALVPLILPEQLEALGIPFGRMWLWRLSRTLDEHGKPRFPVPVRLSDNRIAYRSDEIIEWINSRPRALPGVLTEAQKSTRGQSLAKARKRQKQIRAVKRERQNDEGRARRRRSGRRG